MTAMPTALLLTLVSAELPASSIAHAQTSAGSPREVVRIGDRVRVITPAGERTTGRLTAIDPGGLTLDDGGRRRSITIGAMTRVEVRRRDSLMNGLVAGAGIGTAYGLWIDRYDDCDECHDALWGSVVTGALIGLVIDAIKPAWRPAFLPP